MRKINFFVLLTIITQCIFSQKFFNFENSWDYFIEEQGQFKRRIEKQYNLKIDENILYGLENKDFNAYFVKDGVIFIYPERKKELEDKLEAKQERESEVEFEKDEEIKKRKIIWHYVKLSFNNAKTFIVKGKEKCENYFSYDEYEGDGKYFFKVPCYKKLVYINVYDGIDVEFMMNEKGGIKYQYIVHKNADASKIQEKWIGVRGIDKLTDYLNINLGFTQDELDGREYVLTNHRPVAYYLEDKKEIPVKYNLSSKYSYQYDISYDVNKDIIIDPWLTNTSFPGINSAFEVQEDTLGNVYILGNYSSSGSGQNHWVQKYNSAGSLLWTYQYYSVFLGDIAVDKIGNCYIIGGYCSGKRQKLNPSGTSVLWSLTGWCEEWRLSFNYDRTILSIGGYYYNAPNNNVNLAQLDVNTGALSNMIAYGLETRAIATDCDGSIYSLHFPFSWTPGPSSNNLLNKTSSNFTPLGSVSNGYVLGECGGYPTYYYAPNPDYGSCAYHGINGLTIIGSYVYTYDGITLKRFNKNTLSQVGGGVTVPNGQFSKCSGIASDLCGNVYVGTLNGIAQFDSSMNYIGSISTLGPVYDIILGYGKTYLLAVGQTFVGNFSGPCSSVILSATTNTNFSCPTLGTATITPSGGLPSYTYLWLPSNYTTASVSNLSNGTYTYIVQDSYCQKYQGTLSITLPSTISISSVNVNSVTCNGLGNGSATVSVVNGSGNNTYTWLPIGGTNTVATGLPQNTYSFTAYDITYSCSVTTTLQIIQPPSLSLTAVQSQSVNCNGGNNGVATSTASGGVGGYTYTWMPSGGNSSIASGLTAGIYTLNVLDANSCAISGTVQITQPPALSLTAVQSQSVSCNGGNNGVATSTASGGVGGYTYNWLPTGGNSASASGLTAGVYTLNVLDANNCAISGTVQITQPPALSLTATQVQSVSCNGGNNGVASSTVSGGVGGYSYTWTPSGGNSSTANNLTQGIYTITVSDANNCGPISSTVQIQEPPALSLTATQVQSVSCNGGNNGVATSTASGGVGGYTYTWTPSGGNSSTANNLTQGIYTITVSDGNNCGPISATVQILEPPALSISVSGQSVSCYGYSDGSASVGVSGGVGGYSYTWSPSGGNGSVASNLVAGVYTVDVRDVNNCYISGSINIPQPSSITLVTSPNQTICYGNSTNISAMASGGNPPYNYNWNNGLPNSGGPHLVTLTSTTIYTVQVVDMNNCVSPVGQIKVNVLPMLSAMGMQTVVCDGLSTNVYVSITSPGNGGPYSYLWSNGMSGGTVTVMGNYSMGSQNIYTVYVSDGCSVPDAVAEVTVNVYPNPVISFSAVPVKGCVPLTVQYSGMSDGVNDVYQWYYDNGESGVGAGGITTYTQSGLYTPTLVVTNVYGCVSSSVAVDYVEVYPKPIADFSMSSNTVSILEPEVSFYNESVGATSYTWNFGDYGSMNNVSYEVNPEHSYMMSGTYTVMLVAMNNKGCYDNIAKVLYVEPEFHLYIPNVFTPDGNGINDVFQPKGIGIDENDYKMMIFDRWGELIFQSNDFRKGWDGSVKGNAGKATQDVYVYKIYVRDLKGNKHEFVGHVTCLPYTKE